MGHSRSPFFSFLKRAGAGMTPNSPTPRSERKSEWHSARENWDRDRQGLCLGWRAGRPARLVTFRRRQSSRGIFFCSFGSSQIDETGPAANDTSIHNIVWIPSRCDVLHQSSQCHGAVYQGKRVHGSAKASKCRRWVNDVAFHFTALGHWDMGQG